MYVSGGSPPRKPGQAAGPFSGLNRKGMQRISLGLRPILDIVQFRHQMNMLDRNLKIA